MCPSCWPTASGTSRCVSSATRRLWMGVAGVSNVVVRATHLSCELEGDVRPFLAAIHGAAITDLTIEPARLEEAFLEYYADEDDGRGRRG